jgi:hypothetical protein
MPRRGASELFHRHDNHETRETTKPIRWIFVHFVGFVNVW